MRWGSYGRSLSYCPETCDDVENAIKQYLDRFGSDLPDWIAGEMQRDLWKIVQDEGANKVRHGLVVACGDLIELEERVAELEADIDERDRRIADLESELEALAMVEGKE
jgi:hypothetical protein